MAHGPSRTFWVEQVPLCLFPVWPPNIHGWAFLPLAQAQSWVECPKGSQLHAGISFHPPFLLSWVLLANVDKHLGRLNVPGEPSVTTPQGCSWTFLRACVLLLFKQFVSFIYKCFIFYSLHLQSEQTLGTFSQPRP